jgi:hypothetical protein
MACYLWFVLMKRNQTASKCTIGAGKNNFPQLLPSSQRPIIAISTTTKEQS